jgi:hypothetical protein
MAPVNGWATIYVVAMAQYGRSRPIRNAIQSASIALAKVLTENTQSRQDGSIAALVAMGSMCPMHDARSWPAGRRSC